MFGAVRVKLAESPSEWAGAVAVRFSVFVDEQRVPAAAELDEHDRTSLHAVAVLPRVETRLATAQAFVVIRAAAQAGKYLPVSLAGARTSAQGTAPLAPVVGTARLLGSSGGQTRIGRLAVLSEWRGQGVGSRLLRLMEEAALARGSHTSVLHAQTYLESFYANHGYAISAPRTEFLEDGILHVRMTKPLSLEME